MKKFFQSAVSRSVCLLVLGVLLVMFSKPIPTWLVMACGVLFILPGAATLIGYFSQKQKGMAASALLPFISGGSILFGLVLLLFPAFFIQYFLYALAAMLMVAGAAQCYSVWSARSMGARVPDFLYVLPILIFVVGLLIILYWREPASLPFIIMGVACIAYAVVELLVALLVNREAKRRLKIEKQVATAGNAAEEAVVIEETTAYSSPSAEATETEETLL